GPQHHLCQRAKRAAVSSLLGRTSNQQNQKHCGLCQERCIRMTTQQKRPLLNIRATVAYPGTEVFLHIGRQRSLNSINMTHADKRKEIILVSQRECENNDPSSIADLYGVGVLATITKSIKLADAMKIYCACQ